MSINSMQQTALRPAADAERCGHRSSEFAAESGGLDLSAATGLLASRCQTSPMQEGLMQPLRERPNNEIGILFHEPELAADASKRFNEHVDRVAFKVELVDRGNGSKSRSWLHIIGFPAVMAVAVYLIIDLEFPRLGLVRIDAFDQALVELRASMK